MFRLLLFMQFVVGSIAFGITTLAPFVVAALYITGHIRLEVAAVLLAALLIDAVRTAGMRLSLMLHQRFAQYSGRSCGVHYNHSSAMKFSTFDRRPSGIGASGFRVRPAHRFDPSTGTDSDLSNFVAHMSGSQLEEYRRAQGR
jgi:hypothetical protein